jgi:hypothetical protein
MKITVVWSFIISTTTWNQSCLKANKQHLKMKSVLRRNNAIKSRKHSFAYRSHYNFCLRPSTEIWRACAARGTGEVTHPWSNPLKSNNRLACPQCSRNESDESRWTDVDKAVPWNIPNKLTNKWYRWQSWSSMLDRSKHRKHSSNPARKMEVCPRNLLLMTKALPYTNDPASYLYTSLQNSHNKRRQGWCQKHLLNVEK